MGIVVVDRFMFVSYFHKASPDVQECMKHKVCFPPAVWAVWVTTVTGRITAPYAF